MRRKVTALRQLCKPEVLHAAGVECPCICLSHFVQCEPLTLRPTIIAPHRNIPSDMIQHGQRAREQEKLISSRASRLLQQPCAQWGGQQAAVQVGCQHGQQSLVIIPVRPTTQKKPVARWQRLLTYLDSQVGHSSRGQRATGQACQGNHAQHLGISRYPPYGIYG